MIDIKYYRKAHRVMVTGHANTAPEGQDLLCAAVSTLINTLAVNANSLDSTGCCRSVSIKLNKGDADISAQPLARYRSVVTLVFDTICLGLEQLAMQHSDNIHFVDKDF